MSEINWAAANQNQRFMPGNRSFIQPKIDEVISKIVGKNVLASDPVLLNLLVKWKHKTPVRIEKIKSKTTGREVNVEMPTNITNNPEFIKELKEIYA